MAKSRRLINSNRTDFRSFLENDESIDEVFEYMFIDSGKIVGVYGKKTVMTTTFSVEIDLASEIYQRLFSQAWIKTEEVWPKKDC